MCACVYANLGLHDLSDYIRVYFLCGLGNELLSFHGVHSFSFYREGGGEQMVTLDAQTEKNEE